MRVCTLARQILVLALTGCGGSQPGVGSSVGPKEAGDEPEAAAEDSQQAGGAGGAAADADAEPTSQLGAGPPPSPPPDPALVKALVAKTGESPSVDNPLHLRLEVTPLPVGERWLVAVVNRGTEPASVLFDLRRLTLSLETPEDPQKPRPKWQKKPAPLVCKLPEGFGGPQAFEETPRRLEPGEGLVRTFDPRLYCVSSNGESLLKTGQLVTPKLGYAPKPPKVVYRQGKRTEVAVLQSAPFVAEPAPAEAASRAPAVPDPEHDSRVKELVAGSFELTRELSGNEAEEDTSLPLTLRLLRGSDVANERTATVTLEVRARGQKTSVYFRRELVSFTVHGPDGIRGCDPQPDDRAPDRQAYSTLAAGKALTATSMLAELCPNYTFGRPGLYLLSARFDAVRDGAEFGLGAFTGRLESPSQALVRVRIGDWPPWPPEEPIRVRVGE